MNNNSIKGSQTIFTVSRIYLSGMRYFFVLTVFFSAFRLLAQKQVSITLDDLPLGGGSRFITLADIIHINEEIIRISNAYKVPVIGFVNEQKLSVAGEEKKRTDILRSWLDGGLTLGNHTYSHPSLFKTALDKFEEEVLKGEMITKKLMKDKGLELTYFRHPFLNTGPDSTTKASFELFLTDHGYTVAPVTVESSDYIFNKVYVDAISAEDSAFMREVGEMYVNHTLRMFDFAEEATMKIVGRPIPHIFLCHANPLNADYIDQIYSGLEKKGYTFITLSKALEDKVYESEDAYIGARGFVWLYRWDGANAPNWLKAEPQVDEKILSLYRN